MKDLKTITIIILLLSVRHYCVGQFNDSTHYHVFYNSTGSFAKTNDAQSFVLNNLARLGYSKNIVEFQLTSGWVYGEQSGAKINNDFANVLEADFLKHQQKLYYWALGTFDKSYSLKIDYRVQTGAGIGYTVVRRPDAMLVISDGFIYEKGDMTDGEIGEIRYDRWRNSLRVKYHWLAHNLVNLEGSAFVQPALSDFDDVVIRSSTTLSVRLRKWLSLTASLTYNKISLTRRENLIATYGIQLERFF